MGILNKIFYTAWYAAEDCIRQDRVRRNTSLLRQTLQGMEVDDYGSHEVPFLFKVMGANVHAPFELKDIPRYIKDHRVLELTHALLEDGVSMPEIDRIKSQEAAKVNAKHIQQFEY